MLLLLAVGINNYSIEIGTDGIVSKNSVMKMGHEFAKLEWDTVTETHIHKHVQTKHALRAIPVDPLFCIQGRKAG